MTPQVRVDVGVLVYSILLNIPINYLFSTHPMNLLPSIASTISSSNTADLFTRPLPATTHHRFISLIGAGPTVDPLASANPTATVATPRVVASTVDPLATTATTISDSVQPLHPNPAPTLPIVLDTGASFSLTSFKSDFIQAPFGLIGSASTSVASNFKASSKDYSNDPYTLITGEDVSVNPIDLSSTDSDSEFASSIESFYIWEFGTATLVFISNSELTTILVEPTLDWTDWFDWIPLPRLTPTESYYHIFGLNYSQAFALFHLIPIWIALVFALLRLE